MYIGAKSTPTATRNLLGDWIQVSYSDSTALKYITIVMGASEIDRAIRRFVLVGGSTGSGPWSEVAEFSGILWNSASFLRKTFTFAPSSSYAFFRLVILENSGSGLGMASIGELFLSAAAPPQIITQNDLTISHPDGRAFKYDAASDAIRLNTGDPVTFDVDASADVFNAARGRIALKASGTGNYFRRFGSTIRLNALECSDNCYDFAWAFFPNASGSSSYALYNDFNSAAGGTYLGYDPATDAVQNVGPASPLRINNWLISPALDATLSLPLGLRVTATAIGALAGSAGMTQLYSGTADDSALAFTIPFSFKLLNVRPTAACLRRVRPTCPRARCACRAAAPPAPPAPATPPITRASHPSNLLLYAAASAARRFSLHAPQKEYGNGANGGVWMSANTYITLGCKSLAFGSFSASNPPCPTLFLGAADNSYQRVWGLHVVGSGYRVRYEGTAAQTGTVGSPNIVLEITFETGGDIVVDVGQHARTGGQLGLTNGGGVWALTNYKFVVGGMLANNMRYRVSGLV